MARVLEDGDLRRALSERGRRRAQGFDWHAAARSTLAVYEMAVNGSR
jgi:glycosyltransferase involved in cell wall biosynthesis